MRKLMIVSALLAGAFTANSNAPRTEAATDAFGIETGLSYISVASVDFSGRFVVLEALPYFEHLPSGAPRERVRVDRVKHTTTPLPTLIAVGNGGWYGITPDGRWLDIAAGTSTPAPAGAEYLMVGDGQLYVVVTASGPSLIVDGRSGATSAVPLSGRPVAISNNGRYVLTGTCSTSQPPVLECHDYRRWDRFLGDVDAIYTSTDARVLHAVGDNGRVAVVDRSRNPFPPPERIYDTITVHGPEGFVRSFKAGFPSAMSADGNYLVVYANCGIDSCMISAVEIESGSTQVIARDSFGIVGPVLLSGTGSSTAYVRNGVGESISRVVVEGDAIKGAPVVGHVLAGEVFELPPTGSSQQAQTQVLNVTVTNPSSDGYLTVWPCGEPIPATSNLNFAAGQTVANATVTAVGENGAICFTSNAQLDLIVDRSGAFASAESFHAVSPRRLEDTRTSAASGRVRRGTILAVPMPADVRQNAIAVALNITIVNPAQDGYVTVWPCGTPPPATSNGNFAVGQTVALATITAVANAGTVCVVRTPTPTSSSISKGRSIRAPCTTLSGPLACGTPGADRRLRTWAPASPYGFPSSMPWRLALTCRLCPSR